MGDARIFRGAAICECGDHGFVGLTQGLVAFVDADKVRLVSERGRWALSGRRGAKYPAKSTRDGAYLYLHRLVIGAKQGEVVDHIDNDTLNARVKNLRICKTKDNAKNRRRSLKASCAFKGVFYHEARGRWSAKICANGAISFLGYFDCPVEAAAAYDHACIDLHGDFAKTNAELFCPSMWQVATGKRWGSRP